MRLQKQKTREVKGKEYFRWSVVIPPAEVTKLGWKEGDDLEGIVVGEGILMKKSRGGKK